MRTSVIRSMGDLDAPSWDALAGQDDPFAEHAFLAALEESGSVGEGTGWQPMHVVVHQGSRLIGALPLYEKDDSWGEYIFDFQWAHAARQAGVRYYPKLTAMAPFTPATGTRLLIHPEAERGPVVRALFAGALAQAKERDASGVHALFLSEAERAEVLRETELMPRLSMQFHWESQGWKSWDEYVDAFRSSARKQVRKERRSVAQSGIEIAVRSGPELSDGDWRAIDTFYRLNCARHGSFPYLAKPFFPIVRRTMAERLVAVIAYEGGAPIAASVNFEKGRHLYGRYWGAATDSEHLHFECCYYRLIERAIERGITRFEAGAQGMHKLKRGLLPSPVHSAHWVRDRRLAAALEDFLPSEAMQVTREIEALTPHGPFRRGED